MKRIEYTAALTSLLVFFAFALSGCEVLVSIIGNTLAYGLEDGK